MSLRIEMNRHGPPEVLQAVERADAPPGPGEVAVRVAVAGVNRADCFIRSGEWSQGGTWPYTPGLEACGWVTAWLALATLEPRAGQRVLVTGATSAVGVMVIQLLAAAGCIVIASGRRADRLERLRSLGAGEVVVTAGDPGWADRLAPVDRVFDLVGRATFAAAVDLLAPHGRLVFVGGTSGGELELSGWALMRPVVLTGYSSETLDRDQLGETMQHIAAAAAAGTLRVPALERVPLAEAAAAHRMLEAGENAGRVVLVPGG